MTTAETTPGRDACYLAFGLRLTSEIELPELPRTEMAGGAAVVVRFGEVANGLTGGVTTEPGVTVARDAVLIDCPPARFLIREGREIVVAPKADGSDRDIRGYLLGSAMGAILHQRGFLPLHANAIEVSGKAVAFVGPSGAGKSTLAAYFRRIGRKVLCDDVCAVSLDAAGQPLAWPGIPRIKLWGDALAAFGRGAAGLERVLDGEEKFSLPLPAHPLLGPLPLAHVYVLKRTDADPAPPIRPLSGAEAFAAISSNIYRSEFAAPLGRSNTQFASIVSLLASTRVFEVERVSGFEMFQTEAKRLERHIARLVKLSRTRAKA